MRMGYLPDAAGDLDRDFYTGRIGRAGLGAGEASGVRMAARGTRAPWSVRNTGQLNYRLSSHSHPNPEEHHG